VFGFGFLRHTVLHRIGVPLSHQHLLPSCMFMIDSTYVSEQIDTKSATFAFCDLATSLTLDISACGCLLALSSCVCTFHCLMYRTLDCLSKSTELICLPRWFLDSLPITTFIANRQSGYVDLALSITIVHSLSRQTVRPWCRNSVKVELKTLAVVKIISRKLYEALLKPYPSIDNHHMFS
jgi:hypothetical protein